jgi:K+-sensing histidine kinase KdpD
VIRYRASWIAWATWCSILFLCHLVLLQTRKGDVRQAQVALAFLLIVLGGSASGARGLGAFLAVVSFLLIDYSYQAPFGTLTVAKSVDWVVLVAFLATAIVATELVQRARDEATRADQRAQEVLRLTADARRVAALEEADRLKDALLASVSHDLRTPLTTIRSLASEIGVPSAEATEIIAQVDRLDRMVRNLLDFSRVSAGTNSHPEINTAEDLIGATLRQLAAPLRGRVVRTKVIGNDVLIGRFDFADSLRALSNLLDNALRYSPSNEPIDISARQAQDSLLIEVADRGVGVPAGEDERIFLPFYRPAGSAPDTGNAGLGLAIARRIAESQGGSLTFARQEGGGSRFTLRLPAAVESESDLDIAPAVGTSIGPA